MRIEPVFYQPYVYRTNAISSNSLSKVNPIGDDLLATKTDFSGLTKSTETINPLRRGETANFADVLMMQMQMGRMNAERIMKPEEQPLAGDKIQPVEISQRVEASEESAQMSGSMMNGSAANGSSYQMQRATAAYQMFMTA